MIPVVRGPNQHHYVVDEGVKDVLVTVIADLSMVDRDAFWVVMDNRQPDLENRQRERLSNGHSQTRRQAVNFSAFSSKAAVVVLKNEGLRGSR